MQIPDAYRASGKLAWLVPLQRRCHLCNGNQVGAPTGLICIAGRGLAHRDWKRHPRAGSHSPGGRWRRFALSGTGRPRGAKPPTPPLGDHH